MNVSCVHRYLVLLLATILLALPIAAQPDPAQERATLREIDTFYLVVDLEVSGELREQTALDISEIRQQVLATLRGAGLDVLDTPGPDTETLPYLYLHVNTLDAGGGLIPFSVQGDFYQAVRLRNRRGSSAQGSTWNVGNVGIVSIDLIHTIPASVLDVVQLFIDDYRTANPQ